MKTMTCKDLAGACDKQFHANTFEEIAEMSKKHGMEMANKRDEAHLGAMEKMNKLMSDPKAMQAWMKTAREKFDSLSEN